jgi:DNA-binding beta-propeller fold protein YncE
MKFIPSVLVVLSVLFLASCGDGIDKDPVYPKATHLYFSDYSGKKIGVIDLNNSPNTFTTIADESKGLDTLAGIAIDFLGGKIYAAEETNNRILRLNIDGSGSVEVLYDEADSVRTPTALALDVTNNILYWSNSGTGQMKKGSLDGAAMATSMFEYDTVLSYSYGLAYDPTRKELFYSDLGDYASIWYFKTDGTVKYPSRFFNINNLTLQNPSGIYLDASANLIYWADEGLRKIVGSNLSGSPAVLFDRQDGVTRPDGIAIDKGSGKIYWTETDPATDTHLIARGNLDGTGTREVLVQGVESYSIVLQFEK